jgi:LPXTG-motif cell wall-anchored protein
VTSAAAASNSGKAAAAGDVTTRDDNNASVSYLPADQTSMTTGTADSIAASAASQNVGSDAVATVTAGTDDDDQPNGYNSVTIGNRSTASSASSTASINLDTGLDANTLLAGDVKHYGEFTDGGWQINTLTMTDGIKPAETTSYELDVTPIVNGDATELVYTIASGVKVYITKGNISDDDAGLLTHHYIPGANLTVTIFGNSVFNDITQTRVTTVDGNGQTGRGYINVPFTFHYYDADNKLATGILNFVNTKKATTSDSSTTDSSASSTASDASSAASSSSTAASNASTGSSANNSAAGSTATSSNAQTSTATGTTTTTSTTNPQAAGQSIANVATTSAQMSSAQAATPQQTSLSQTAVTDASTAAAALTASSLAAKSTRTSLPDAGDDINADLLLAGTLVTGLVGLLGVTKKRRDDEAR